MKILLTILLCIVPLCSYAQSTHHKNHNDYQSWMTNPDHEGNTYSCCNNKDCDIVKDFGTNDKGEHYISWRGETYYVSPGVWLKDRKSPDGNAHACIIAGRVVCFVPGDQMF